MRGKLEISPVWGKLQIKFPVRTNETEAIIPSISSICEHIYSKHVLGARPNIIECFRTFPYTIIYTLAFPLVFCQFAHQSKLERVRYAYIPAPHSSYSKDDCVRTKSQQSRPKTGSESAAESLSKLQTFRRFDCRCVPMSEGGGYKFGLCCPGRGGGSTVLGCPKGRPIFHFLRGERGAGLFWDDPF